ncbi:MAG: uncharacterized protein PWR29_1695 [Methanolobus sp.]|jgi:hypothetical protein|nr:uncharacterized protein [Methanolobus sp.]MDK2834838.1 uncharacterized protein [Methanolobus sp.]MDK2912738.1 uncharacterized protein [Methanolobus sp.]MDN5309516.1 uncharacterized protein [Methanolobus sp.]
MYLKIHKAGESVIVAVCDRELLGKSLREGNINVTISEEFYKGDLVSEDDVMAVITKAGNVNLFGDKVVSCAVKCGVVDPSSVKIIDGVAHAQVFRI